MIGSNLQTAYYNGQRIEFNLGKANVLVNATEMAIPFGKMPKDFLRNSQTQNFIQAILKANSPLFIGIKRESDLYMTQKKSGTWMQRMLALKFAAWLSPEFEVWVYSTIEELLYGDYKKVQESYAITFQLQRRQLEIKEHLRKTCNEFNELEDVEIKLKQEVRRRNQNLTKVFTAKSFPYREEKQILN
jgi:hypothetical protein